MFTIPLQLSQKTIILFVFNNSRLAVLRFGSLDRNLSLMDYSCIHYLILCNTFNINYDDELYFYKIMDEIPIYLGTESNSQFHASFLSADAISKINFQKHTKDSKLDIDVSFVDNDVILATQSLKFFDLNDFIAKNKNQNFNENIRLGQMLLELHKKELLVDVIKFNIREKHYKNNRYIKDQIVFGYSDSTILLNNTNHSLIFNKEVKLLNLLFNKDIELDTPCILSVYSESFEERHSVRLKMYSKKLDTRKNFFLYAFAIDEFDVLLVEEIVSSYDFHLLSEVSNNSIFNEYRK